MWWILLGWMVASFVVAVVFGHVARRDEHAEHRPVVSNDIETSRNPVLH